MQPYVIRAGDYLTRLASRHGFDVEEVWNHEDNRQLRETRASYDVLAPGDIVHLPIQPAAMHPLSARTTNRYRGRPATISVQVRLVLDDEPVRNAAVHIDGMTPEIDTETDGDGMLSFEAPVHVDRVVAHLADGSFSFELMIGHLDPLNEDSGVAGRLVNLGYLQRGREQLPRETQQLMVAIAITRFQQDHDLDVSGEIDDQLRDALREAHGS